MLNKPPQRDRIDSVRRRALHLSTVEPGHRFADLEPLRSVVGEATHGTREFFQLKHRLVEFLVAARGVTTFAIEANWPECEVVNAYIRFGEGELERSMYHVQVSNHRRAKGLHRLNVS